MSIIIYWVFSRNILTFVSYTRWMYFQILSKRRKKIPEKTVFTAWFFFWDLFCHVFYVTRNILVFRLCFFYIQHNGIVKHGLNESCATFLLSAMKLHQLMLWNNFLLKRTTISRESHWLSNQTDIVPTFIPELVWQLFQQQLAFFEGSGSDLLEF